MQRLIEITIIVAATFCLIGCGKRNYIRTQDEVFGDINSIVPVEFVPERGVAFMPTVVPNLDGGFDAHIPRGHAWGYWKNHGIVDIKTVGTNPWMGD